jgi:hypothetical protein
MTPDDFDACAILAAAVLNFAGRMIDLFRRRR